jgi:hypothetical protein
MAATAAAVVTSAAIVPPSSFKPGIQSFAVAAVERFG